MRDSPKSTATDMDEPTALVRDRRCNHGKVPTINSQAQSRRLQLFGRRTEDSSNGTSREILAELDSLSAFSTRKLLAEEAQASKRSTPLSYMSTFIDVDDLATTYPTLGKILSSLSKKSPAYQDPVPFMRLPAEIRVMIYVRTWTVVDCPQKMTLRAGRRDSGNCLATGIEYWLGPAPRTQVRYPKVVMTMDSRIKEEFVYELCTRFPVQLYISGLFTERIPDLSIHKPSVFFKHVRDCQIQYLPPFLSDPNHIYNASDNRMILGTDLASLVKFSLLFPCLEKMVIHMPLDFRVLLSDNVTSLNVNSVLQMIIGAEVHRGGKKELSCFAAWKDDSFIMGWHTDKTPRSNHTEYYSRICTALSARSHDAENCTSARCQCTALILMGPHRTGRRLFNYAAQWFETNPDAIHLLIVVKTIIAAFWFWPYTASLATLFNLDIWREACLPTLIRLLLQTLGAELILDYSRKTWRKRSVFYGVVHIVGYRIRQTLGTYVGDVPLSALARLGYCFDRSVSFIVELFIGILFETFVHVICWVTYGLYLFMPQTLSFILAQDRQLRKQLKHLPVLGFGYLAGVSDLPPPKLVAVCLSGTPVAFGLTGCGAVMVSVLFCLHMLPTFHSARKSWPTATVLARRHRTKVAQACGNVKSDLRDLEWIIRTAMSWIVWA
ncbi:uncharacterized protein BKCO1_1000132 [Diplodia corticola]|uniref:Uncharacterized protein n=1 Tax=Diplodia corticola TaxID=236234 RepID=A0A1J9SM56_9PEZI|nr:uncharacterized protein BKCO1_1000132 [Diplodia corticola]OJD40804.1 hypothetical protein BKCO1_1000132 [Diplodia corticola]